MWNFALADNAQFPLSAKKTSTYKSAALADI
jgi:hypothetical protein